MNSFEKNQAPSIIPNKIALLLECGVEIPESKIVIYELKKKYVSENHTYKITYIELDYKLVNQNRSKQTIKDYKYVIQRFFPEQARKLNPSEDMLKKSLQYIKAIYSFAIRQKWRSANPAFTVDFLNLYSLCNLSVKTDDEKSFPKRSLKDSKTMPSAGKIIHGHLSNFWRQKRA